MQLRLGLVLAAGLLVLLAVYVNGGSQQQQTPPLPPPPPGAGAPPPVRPPEPELELDLLAATDKPVELEATGGVYTTLRIINRAPATAYRVRTSGTGRNPGVRDLFAPYDSELRTSTEPPEECANAAREWQAFLRVTKEADVAAAVARFKAAVGAHPACPMNAFYSGQFENKVNPEAGSFSLSPGQEIRFVVERVDPQTKATTATWTAIVRPTVPRMAWSYATEEAWLIGETARDIAAALTAANGGPATQPITAAVEKTAGGYRVSLKAGGAELAAVPIAIVEYVWSPRTYAPLAATLLKSGPPAGSGNDPATASAADRLAALDAAGLADEDERVSLWLARAPRSAAAHESAALVAGALAMREAAGQLSDTRRLLCRMAAHLAVADAVRGTGSPSPDGRLAAAILEALAGRAKASLALLDQFPAKGATQQTSAWVRALRMRSTGDWRLLANPKQAARIEQLEYVRAIAASMGDLYALDSLSRIEPGLATGWMRAVRTASVSVEGGNSLTGPLLQEEMKEARAVWRKVGGDAASAAAPAAAIGAACEQEGPSAAATRALDRSMWACSFERHVIAAIDALDTHLAKRLGDQEATRVLRDEVAALTPWKRLSALRLRQAITPAAPAGRPDGGFDMAAVEARCADVVDLVRVSPDAIDPQTWEMAHRMCLAARESGTLRAPGDWFVPAVPSGTSYDAAHRLMNGALAARFDRPMLDAMHGLGSFDPVIFVAYVGRKYGRDPTAAEFGAELGPVADYNLRELRRWARLAQDRPAEEMPLLRKLCSISGDDCLVLGRRLVRDGKVDEATAAYQQGFERSRDRVSMSWDMDWLVDRYLDHGKAEKASAIAAAVGEVGSYAGLFTQGRLHERMAQFQQAEAAYRQIAARYGDETVVASYFIRRAYRTPGAQAKADAVKVVFPDGMDKVTVASFQADRSEAGFMPREEIVGIEVVPGDVVLALDGYRVATKEQFDCVASLTDTRAARLIVRRSGQIVALEGGLERHRFGPPNSSL